ncbi:hypothetical protein ILUMI_23033 [Ignelater luminosus]|uniref:Uncharacterized protein n=1 Tax=Ignelater luminosus TaxID=2038154 RepID=A0A8K0G294_IGNLU|nr:hypothetical protein ILUMI_23033 [Ignelater luminosus]
MDLELFSRKYQIPIEIIRQNNALQTLQSVAEIEQKRIVECEIKDGKNVKISGSLQKTYNELSCVLKSEDPITTHVPGKQITLIRFPQPKPDLVQTNTWTRIFRELKNIEMSSGHFEYILDDNILLNTKYDRVSEVGKEESNMIRDICATLRWIGQQQKVWEQSTPMDLSVPRPPHDEPPTSKPNLRRRDTDSISLQPLNLVVPWPPPRDIDFANPQPGPSWRYDEPPEWVPPGETQRSADQASTGLQVSGTKRPYSVLTSPSETKGKRSKGPSKTSSSPAKQPESTPLRPKSQEEETQKSRSQAGASTRSPQHEELESSLSADQSKPPLQLKGQPEHKKRGKRQSFESEQSGQAQRSAKQSSSPLPESSTKKLKLLTATPPSAVQTSIPLEKEKGKKGGGRSKTSSSPVKQPESIPTTSEGQEEEAQESRSQVGALTEAPQYHEASQSEQSVQIEEPGPPLSAERASTSFQKKKHEKKLKKKHRKKHKKHKKHSKTSKAASKEPESVQSTSKSKKEETQESRSQIGASTEAPHYYESTESEQSE